MRFENTANGMRKIDLNNTENLKLNVNGIDYGTYHVTSDLESLEKYSVNIYRKKRQTSATQSSENASQSLPTELIKSNESQLSTETIPPSSNSDSSAWNRSSSNSNKNNTSNNASVSLSKSTSEIVLEQRPLLGVNGTGQRKNLTQPFMVSDPISDTTSSSKVSKPIQLTTEEPAIIDEIDIPFNESEVAKQNNITDVKESYYTFYNSSSSVDAERVNTYWDAYKNLSINSMLSKSHRRAITVQLKFDFPFYGHPVRNVTVATGGFLYTGEYVHSWLAATQYIGPLMANFDTSISNNSFVRFDDNGTAFTVLWQNVSLQDRQDVGQFTFSVTLHDNGDIVFAYYSLPMLIDAIQDDKHPVKIGLSDAYIIDKTIFFARRKIIYEYHRVNFDGQEIANNTIIKLTANPTCHSLTDCEKCVNSEKNLSFKCFWCPTLNKCSTGTDRKRQEWLQKACDRTQVNDASNCPAIGTKGNNYGAVQDIEIKDVTGSGDKYMTSDSSTSNVRTNNDVHMDSVSRAEILAHEDGNGVGMALGLFVPIILVMSLVMWIFYAYRNPHTKSGQLLIQLNSFKYRPSQWSWRRGEARYTAATIHM